MFPALAYARASDTRKMNRSSLLQVMIRNSQRLVAMVMLLACLSTSVPLIASSAGSACALACCAGRAPHAEASCKDGSCHASLSTRHKTTGDRHRAPNRAEQFCGAPLRTKITSLSRISSSKTISPERSGETHLAQTMLVTPCRPDCGACPSGSSSNRQRDRAGIAKAEDPPLPLSVRRADFADRRSQTLDALCHQHAPRGPPLSFS
jgi:hypothetical protein